MKLLETLYYGNSLRAWIIAAGILVLAVGAMILLKRIVLVRLTNLARRTSSRVDDGLVEVLRSTRFAFVVLLATGIAAHALILPTRVDDWVDGLAKFALFVQLALWVNAFIAFSVSGYVTGKVAENPTGVTTVRAVAFVARLLVWSLIFLLVLKNVFEVDVTTLIAGLGITGIAVALAVQNVLADLLAALSIVLDKPFVIGDSIEVDGYSGSVEHVGLKTTRVRSSTGEEIIFSNGDLLKSRVRNFKRMYERRALLVYGVSTDTRPEVVERVPAMLREIVQAQQHVRLERAHFRGFGPSSLDFEVVYFVTSPEYGLFMDIQQAVHLAVMRRFASERIEFAVPAQSLRVVSLPPGVALPAGGAAAGAGGGATGGVAGDGRGGRSG